MTRKESPYIVSCSFCENGLLRPTRCGSCDGTVAICDECELIWKSIESVYRDPKVKSDGAFPECPNCRAQSPEWARLGSSDLAECGLDSFITDVSI